MVQLVLTLFRNVLAIQDISTQQKSGGSMIEFVFLRDRFLELLFKENIMEVILVLSQQVGGSCSYLRHDNLLLLETFYYIFMGQLPELIAKAHFKDPKVSLFAISWPQIESTFFLFFFPPSFSPFCHFWMKLQF